MRGTARPSMTPIEVPGHARVSHCDNPVVVPFFSNSRTPAKKTKLHPLSKEPIISNRALSQERILIENIIRKLKIYRILSERLRNRRKRFGLRFNLIAAFSNMELENVY